MADTNFKLNNRTTSTEERDPGLATGYSYFVPQDNYNKYVLQHVDQREVRLFPAIYELSQTYVTRRLALAPDLPRS
jgi:hypothetical protein